MTLWRAIRTCGGRWVPLLGQARAAGLGPRLRVVAPAQPVPVFEATVKPDTLGNCLCRAPHWTACVPCPALAQYVANTALRRPCQMDVAYDSFIRTTDTKHESLVVSVLDKVSGWGWLLRGSGL